MSGAVGVVGCNRHTPMAIPMTATSATRITIGLLSGDLAVAAAEGGAAAPPTMSVPSSVNRVCAAVSGETCVGASRSIGWRGLFAVPTPAGATWTLSPPESGNMARHSAMDCGRSSGVKQSALSIASRNRCENLSRPRSTAGSRMSRLFSSFALARARASTGDLPDMPR